MVRSQGNFTQMIPSLCCATHASVEMETRGKVKERPEEPQRHQREKHNSCVSNMLLKNDELLTLKQSLKTDTHTKHIFAHMYSVIRTNMSIYTVMCRDILRVGVSMEIVCCVQNGSF